MRGGLRQSMRAAAIAAMLLAAGCGSGEGGPLRIDAIGGEPRIVNPNLRPLDPPGAVLLYATAQGLVRFDAAGQIEPALAQSWIVSDDGLRYTFRLAPATWADGRPVTAGEVVGRLRAATSRASRNPLKSSLGVVADVAAMTERVLEVTLQSPRPNFLQLLAQPEMAILRGGGGTGPYRAAPQEGGAVLLAEPVSADEADDLDRRELAPLRLRGARAALAIARFVDGASDIVIGGTAGDLPIVRAAQPGRGSLRFEAASGLFGLEVMRPTGLLADPAARDALSSVIDRAALTETLGAPDPQPRTSLLAPGIADAPVPTAPPWSLLPIEERRAAAIAALTGVGVPLRVRVALPAGPGYRLVFAHLRRDWQAIGVEAQAVGPGAVADLRLIDEVAPAAIGAWYLRRFMCGRVAVCDPSADAALLAARAAPSAAERRLRLEEADRLLTTAVPFIPLAQPLRWTLAGPRAAGYQANAFALRFPGSLLARR